MTNRTYGWILVAVVVVFAIVAIFAWHKNHERALTIPTAGNLALYQNDTYGYSFYYPTDYTVRVASEEDIIIGMATTSGFVEYAETRIATTAPDTASYDTFVSSAALALCSVKAGYACSKVAERSGFTSETNLSGTKLYLDMTTPDGTNQRFGPIYAFNIGGNVTNAKYATVFVYRPLGATGAVETLPAEDIAGKFTITKVEKR